MTSDKAWPIVDARGLKCPLPAIRAEKAAARLKPGEGFELLATDPMAKVDIAVFCKKNGLDVTTAEDDGVLSFRVTRPAS